jgi:hypothetical protein
MTEIESTASGDGIQTAQAPRAEAKDKRPQRILAGVLALALAVGVAQLTS